MSGVDVAGVIGTLMSVVRTDNGNLHKEINDLLEEADKALAAVAELIEADREWNAAQFGLARARYNGGPLGVWAEDCAKAEIRRAAALAAATGESHE